MWPRSLAGLQILQSHTFVLFFAARQSRQKKVLNIADTGPCENLFSLNGSQQAKKQKNKNLYWYNFPENVLAGLVYLKMRTRMSCQVLKRGLFTKMITFFWRKTVPFGWILPALQNGSAERTRCRERTLQLKIRHRNTPKKAVTATGGSAFLYCCFMLPGRSPHILPPPRLSGRGRKLCRNPER